MENHTQPDEKLLDHNYDGIQELDNPLPRWWVNLFYITIVFAFGYVLYYGLGFGDSLAEAHEKTLKEKQLASTSSAPKEVAVSFAFSKATVEKGKGMYESRCAACHKADGGGLVGPNLTDKYWIHGQGKNEDIYAVISEGVPEKGMLSWKAMLSPDDIVALVAYIQTTLQGSHPANAKVPEGTLFQ